MQWGYRSYHHNALQDYPSRQTLKLDVVANEQGDDCSRRQGETDEHIFHRDVEHAGVPAADDDAAVLAAEPASVQYGPKCPTGPCLLMGLVLEQCLIRGALPYPG